MRALRGRAYTRDTRSIAVIFVEGISKMSGVDSIVWSLLNALIAMAHGQTGVPPITC